MSLSEEHMGANVFTYGSLMFDRVWSLVVNTPCRKSEARLHGYRRGKIRDESYPAVVPGADSDTVAGILYLDVAEGDMQRLDLFEGEQYQRERVECELPDGVMIAAFAYVFKEQYRDLLEDEDWDPDWFSAIGIHAFLVDYEGFP